MKLNQVIAIEKGVKGRAYSELTELNKVCQKPELFHGFSKQYEKKDDAGESLPPEAKKVQFKVEEILKKVSASMTELFDVCASKDWANMSAKANVQVDGETIIEAVPVTYLLFLEKQLTDLRTFVSNLPELEEAENWRLDEASALYKTAPISTHRTKKVQTPIVLYNATKEHPAQTQMITDDVIAGYWKTEKHSGALPKARKKTIAEKVEALIKAVKFAREEANGTDADNKMVGQKVFGYLLKD